MRPEVQKLQQELRKTFENLQRELARIRTSRASANLLEDIDVEYMGSTLHIKQLASLSVPDAKTVLITPWDKNAVKDIEKGILASGLNLNPAMDGTTLRIVFPPMTEERRLELVKVIGKKAEESRISSRQERDKAIKALAALKESKQMSENEESGARKEIQAAIDAFNRDVEQAAKKKEEEIKSI